MTDHTTHLRRRGFTLVGVLILVALLAVVATAAVTAGVTLQRRSAEEDLLFIGREYRNAFKSYYEAAVSTQRYPNKLEDLLKDPRFPGVRRHLRKIYVDPMTGKPQWGMVPAPGGGIMGVYSLSTEVPIKQALFSPEFTSFEGKQSYADWLFAYSVPIPAPGTGPPAATPGAPAAAGSTAGASAASGQTAGAPATSGSLFGTQSAPGFGASPPAAASAVTGAGTGNQGSPGTTIPTP